MSILQMHTMACGAAALSVAWIFYTWRTYHDETARRRRTLRERVTYMLWVMANAVAE